LANGVPNPKAICEKYTRYQATTQQRTMNNQTLTLNAIPTRMASGYPFSGKEKGTAHQTPMHNAYIKKGLAIQCSGRGCIFIAATATAAVFLCVRQEQPHNVVTCQICLISVKLNRRNPFVGYRKFVKQQQKNTVPKQTQDKQTS